jgi:copper(I)-binding protein
MSSTKSKAILVGVAAGLAIAIFARSSWSPSSDPNLSVVNAYASESASDASAVYVTLHNAGGGDQLVGAASAAASAVSVHGADMTPSGDVKVRGHGDTSLVPGGSHVMLENLRQPLRPGDEVTLQLRFEHSAPIELTVPVLSFDDVLAKVNP